MLTFRLKKKKMEKDFQDGSRCCNVGFPIRKILAIFDIQVIPIIPIKFRVNWPFHYKKNFEIDFQDCSRGCLSWISKHNDLSFFFSSPGALHQVNLCHGLLSVVRPSVVSFSLFRHLLQRHVGLSWNLVGGIVATWRFRIAKIVPFRCPRWPPWRPSWNSSNDISSQTVSPIELKLDRRHHSDTEIQTL